MKICVVGKFPPIEGGVSRDTFWIVHGLVAAGHEVHVVTNADHVEPEYRITDVSAKNARDKILSDLPVGKCHVHSIRSFARTNYIPNAKPFVSAVAGRAIQVVRDHGIDLIFAYYLEPYGVAAEIASRATGVPFGLRHAGSDVGRLMQHPDLGPAYSNAFRNADYVLASTKTYRRLRHLGVSADRLYPLPGASLHEKYFAPAATVDSTRSLQPFTVGMYGKIGETKGTFDLLNALRRLLDAGHNIRLSLMSQGSKRNEEALHQALEVLRLVDHVSISKFRPHWQVPEFIRSVDAVCFLERNFAIPIHQPCVPLEVLACGVPLVVSGEIARKVRLPGGLVSGEHALVVDPTNTTLDDALLKLMQDASLCESIARKGHELYRLAALDSEDHANALDRTFSRILKDVTNRRNEMSVADFQSVIARLYTDRTFRRLFEISDEDALAEYALTDSEVETLKAIDRKAVKQYAVALRRKVRNQFEDALRPYIAAMGDQEWHRFFDRYYSSFPARPGESHEQRMFQCIRFLEEYVAQRPEEFASTPHLLDLARADRLRRELKAAVFAADSMSKINELGVQNQHVNSDSMVALSGMARIAKFGHNIAALVGSLWSPDSAPTPAVGESFALFLAVPGKGDPEVLPINKSLFELLERIDQSEASVAELSSLAAKGQGDDGTKEVVAVTSFLAARGAVRVRAEAAA
jgi:glycosyltransferase involved in cell wall biosynthesis